MKWQVAVTVVVVAILIGAVGVYAFTSNNTNKLLEQGTTSNLLFQESTIGISKQEIMMEICPLKSLKRTAILG